MKTCRILMILALAGFLCSCGKKPEEQLKEMQFDFNPDGFVKAVETGNTEAVKLFIKAKKDVSGKDKEGWTPIAMAALKGQTEIAKLLLEAGAEPGEKQGKLNVKQMMNRAGNPSYSAAQVEETGELSVLMIASQQGHVDLVKLLLEKGADQKTRDKRHGTALMWAAQEGHTAILKELLKGKPDVNAVDQSEQTALMFASNRGNVEAMKTLLDAGAKPDLADKNKFTALMYAASSGHGDGVRALLQKKANPNLTDHEDSTALMRAALKGHPDAVKALLEGKANPNTKAKASNNWTPLMAACVSGNSGVVQSLLDHGADPNIKANQNATAIMLAALHGHTALIPILSSKGADLNAHESKNGNTPLLVAITKENVPMARALLEAGASPNEADMIGFTPLMLCAQEGFQETLKLLIEKKANLNAQTISGTRKGMTALMIGATKGKMEAVQALLHAGADASMKDEKGVTAFSYAVHNKHHDIADLLGSARVQAPAGHSDEGTGELVEIKSSLLGAIQRGEIETARIILDSDTGTEVNVQDEKGWSPLMYAAHGGHIALGFKLLEKGADVKLMDASGWSALILAANAGADPLVQKLLAKGADANQKTRKNTTALMCAAGRGHTAVVKTLLEGGASPQLVDADGKTAIMYASEKGHFVVVDLLKKSGGQ